MGGGAMWPPVTAAAAADGATYTRSASLAQHSPSYQSLWVLSRAPGIPSSTPSTGLANACSENRPSFDVDDDNLDQTSTLEARQNILARKPYFDLGPVPTRMEAEKAIDDLQRLMQSETNFDMESFRSMVCCGDTRMLQSAGYGKGGLPDALNMLLKDPSMQSMVVSISCDEAVWDAILSSRAVQDLQGSLPAAREEKMQSSGEQLNKVARDEKIQSSSEQLNAIATEKTIQRSSERLDIVDFIIKYFSGFTKSKVVELIENFGALLTQIFQPSDKAKPTSELNDLVEETIRSSLHLAVLILLIVIVTRNS